MLHLPARAMGDRIHSASLAELVARHQGPDAIPENGVTTLMLRNMPRSYNANAIMCELKNLSPGSDYDFVYLPWDARRDSNITYAFLNLVDHETALRVFFALSGRTWSLVRTRKTCRVAAAHVQGLPENLANYVVANTGIEDDSPHAPTVFHNGQQIQLKQAVRLFCTGDMLQRAAEAVRAKKSSVPEQSNTPPAFPGDCAEPKVRSTNASAADLAERQKASALYFRREFRQFCQNIERNPCNHEDVDLSLPDGADDTMLCSNVQFWLRFREMCLQFSATPSTIPSKPEPKCTETANSVQTTSRSGVLDMFPHWSRIDVESSAVLVAPRPPGLVRPEGEGNGRMKQEGKFYAKCDVSAGAEQVASCGDSSFYQTTGTAGTSVSSNGNLSESDSSMPDAGLVPLPNFLLTI